MRSLFRAPVLVLATLLIVACSPVKVPSTDGGDDIDAGDGIDGAVVIDANDIDAVPPDPCGGDAVLFEDAEQCYREAFCSMYVRCYGMFESIDECLSYSFGRLNPEVMFNRFEDALDSGKMTYDPMATAVCFAAMRDTECALLDDGPPDAACDNVFDGTLGEGGTCYMTEECAGSNPRCERPSCQLQCCPGVCEPAAGLLESCETSNCVEGAHCVNVPGAGALCQAGEAGSPCAGSSYNCDSGFWCDVSNVPNLCAADFPPGSGCSDDAQCPAPQVCVGDDLSSGVGTCREVSTLNAPCDDECFGLLYCAATADSGTCLALPGLGGNCALSGRCLGNLMCNGTTNLCVNRVGLDGACMGTNACELGLICDSALPGGSSPGQCKNPVTNGSACFYDEQCVSQICAGLAGSLTCQAYASCY